MKKCVIVLAILVSMSSYAQKKKQRYQDKTFQLSLVPGISSHGWNDGWYFNKFSLNLLSGISAGSKHLEVAGISNLSLRYATGIQIAGFANVIGANAFLNLTLREERTLINEEEFSSYFKGLQFSGFLNNVRNDVTGLQFTGGFNISGGSLLGVQIGGIGNIATRDMLGIQISGLYNVATNSSSGLQLSTLLNYSNGTVAGLQISLINRNKEMVGKQSSRPKNNAKSLQLGVLNMSKKMNGTQIGIINIAKGMRGKQVGIINIFSNSSPRDSGKNGVPFGLLNFGSKGGIVRLYSNELFLYNMEFSTGNCGNCSAAPHQNPFWDDYQKFNQNAISFSYNANGSINQPIWSVGYGFERIKYRIYSVTPKKSGPPNKLFFIAYGAKVQHLNWEEKFNASLNIQTSVFAKAGRRFKFLGGVRYIYTGVKINDYITTAPHFSEENKWMLLKIKGTSISHRIWPGYELGIQI